MKNSAELSNFGNKKQNKLKIVEEFTIFIKNDKTLKKNVVESVIHLQSFLKKVKMFELAITNLIKKEISN